jgi:hypothetical protein
VWGNRDACAGERSLQSEFGEASYSRRTRLSYGKEKGPAEACPWKFKMGQFRTSAEADVG